MASWLVQHGAQVTIRIDGQARSVTTVTEFPTEPFQVEAVMLGRSADFVPAELAYLQHLPNLKVLRLSGMRIIDRAVARLAGLKSVQDLHIEACPISPSGWAYLAKMENVRRLTFTNQPITDSVLAQWNGFPNLESLNLANQPVTDAGLKHVGALRSLRVLNLSQTKVGDAGLQHLRDLKQLTELTLGFTRVTDAGLANLASLENLATLDLWATAVTGTGLEPLASLQQLTKLWMGQSKLTDEGCAAIGMLPSLQSLNVSTTGISEAGLRRLQNAANLRELRLTNTSTTDTGLAVLHTWGQLETLDLTTTLISDNGVKALLSIPNLKYLKLTWARVTDRTAEMAREFPNLEYLCLSGTEVTDAGISSLCALPNIKTLRLNTTNVTSAEADKLRAKLPSCNVEYLAATDEQRALSAPTGGVHGFHGGWGKIQFLDEPPLLVRTEADRVNVIRPFRILELSVAGSVCGDGILTPFRALADITLLNLQNARITNRGLEDLRGLKTLETLLLDANPIDDQGLENLTGLTNLRSLSLKATRVTPAGVQVLLDKLPNCRIDSDWLVARTGGPLYPLSPVTQPPALLGLRSWSVLPTGHRDSISAIACSPDGGFVAIAGDDGENFPATVRVWALGAEQKPGFVETAGCSVLRGHDKKIESLAWSPNGKYLASTGQDLTVKCWEPATGRLLRSFLLNSPGYALAWSPTGDRLAVACGTAIALLGIKSGELREVPNTESKGGVAWLPDGKRFLVQSSAGNTATLTVYDAELLELDRSIRTEELTGRSASLSPDGKRIAATYPDKLVRVWDVETCERIQELTAETGEVVHVAWSPSGDRLATVGKSLIVWDAAKGERLATVKLESAPLGVAWTADGRYVAVGLPMAVDLYSAADGTLTDTVAVTGRLPAAKLTINPDGHYRAVGPIAAELVYVVLTDDYRQETYTPAAFADKFGWKN